MHIVLKSLNTFNCKGFLCCFTDNITAHRSFSLRPYNISSFFVHVNKCGVTISLLKKIHNHRYLWCGPLVNYKHVRRNVTAAILGD